MAKLRNQINVSNLETIDDLSRFVSVVFDELYNQINGKLQITQNIQFVTVNASFPAANTQYAFAHDLGVVPTYYIAVTNPTGGVVYAGTTPFTLNNIYLKNTVITSSMTIWIF